ncbi:hypothetical protein B0H14DRAFT_116794 [Mycena olivaceomarginata]|nr:hypothetical protein B0H14DRAFT_116794 [Mycena olivaceomarginata]
MRDPKSCTATSVSATLMFQRIDGKLYGVLNDFDLAAFHDGSVPSTSKQRTGTKPFMARDLLEHPPPRHLYRHDLESFLYDPRIPHVRYFPLLVPHLGPGLISGWQRCRTPRPMFSPSRDFLRKNLPLKALTSLIYGYLILRICLGPALTIVACTTMPLHRPKEGGVPRLSSMKKTLGGAVDFDKFAAILEQPLTS